MTPWRTLHHSLPHPFFSHASVSLLCLLLISCKSQLSSLSALSITSASTSSNQIVLTTSPSLTGTTDSTLNTAPIFTIQDSSGNTLDTYTGNIRLSAFTSTNCSGTALTNALSASANPVSVVSGIARFSQLKILKTSVQSLLATDGTLSTCIQAPSISPGAIASLQFTTQPVGGVTTDQALSTQPVITAYDANGNIKTDFTGTLTLSANSNSSSCGSVSDLGGHISGNTVSASSGVATFSSTHVLSTQAVRLRAYYGNIQTCSNSISISSGTLSALSFLTYRLNNITYTAKFPSTLTTDTGYPILIKETDSNGNTLSSDSTSTLTLTAYASTDCTGASTANAIYTNPILNPVTLIQGTASFSNAKIINTAIHSVKASIGSTTLCNDSLTVSSGSQSSLSFSTQPSSTSTNGTVFPQQPVITLLDSHQNPITTGVAVTLSASGGTFSCTTNPITTDASGLASFSGCNLSGNGSFTLTATAGSLTATSTAVVLPTSSVILTLKSSTKSTLYPQFQISGSMVSTNDWISIYTGADSSCAGGRLVATQKISALPYTITSSDEIIVDAHPSFRAAVSHLGSTYCSDAVSYDYSFLSDVIQVAQGSNFTCSLISNGTVKCWGANDVGQLGDGTNTPHYQASLVSGIASASQITAGDHFACALLNDGSVVCWGGNPYGQLGNDTTSNSNTPVASGITTATQITAGNQHACALLDDGSIQCWGLNSSGQLGNNTLNDSLVPIAVTSLPNIALKIAAGTSHTCAMMNDNTLTCWGSNTYGQIGDGTTSNRNTPTVVTGLSNVSDLASGFAHSCAVLNSGVVKCWGANNKGQVGDGTTSTRLTATTVSGISTATKIQSSGAAGSVLPITPLGFTCAILGDLSVKCWGSNTAGALGDGSTTDRLSPVSMLSVTGVSSISSNQLSSCAVDTNANVRCYGLNDSGELGSSKAESTRSGITDLPYLTNVTKLDSGAYHTCAVLGDNSVQCWGNHASGQVGVGSVPSIQAYPTSIAAFAGTSSIKLGYNTSFVVLNSTSLVGVGNNAYSQMNDGTTDNYFTPTAIGAETSILGVAPGMNHVCEVLTNFTVKCWGLNNYGQLGQGNTTTLTSPTLVAGLSNVTQVSSGNSHSCALINDGSVKCWGLNSYGQVGDASTTTRQSPTTVTGLSSVSAIMSGANFNCALLSGGTVKCWGQNNHGQLGNASTTSSSTPVLVSGLSSISSLSHGSYQNHACAISSTGSLKCWGANANQQLGDGTTTDRSTPVSITIPALADISTGAQFTCAVTVGKTVKCWGNNTNSALGLSRNTVAGYVIQ